MDTLERLGIESELTQLVNRFSHAIDGRRYEELVSLFTIDGEFDRLGQKLEGRPAIAEAYRNRHPYLTRHVITNLLFTRIEADEAEALMYVPNFVGEPDSNGLPVVYALPQPALLEFEDLYCRTEEGWRIARRVARVIMKSEQQPAHTG